MAYYIESKRIPPERLVFKQPEQYDRIMKTKDIEGAYSRIQKEKPENHGNSLRVSDIPGAQAKKTIRNIWGQYDYHPVTKLATVQGEWQEKLKQSQRAPLTYGGQNILPSHLQQNQSQPHIQQSQPNQISQQSEAQFRKFIPFYLNERQHVTSLEPPSQIKEQIIMKVPEVLQKHVDYDKIVQPYGQPLRDSNIYERYKQTQSQLPKHQSIPNIMTQYKLINDKKNMFDSQKVHQYAVQAQSVDNFQNNYNNFNRGFTPTAKTVQNYQNTNEQLQQKQQEISQKAKTAERNFMQNNNLETNQSKFYGNNDNQQGTFQNNQSAFYGAQQQSNLQESQNNYNTGLINRKQPQNWSNNEFNIIGNYPRDKRVYDRSGPLTAIEKQYYQNYDSAIQNQIRKSQQEFQKNKYRELQPGYQTNKQQFYGTYEPQQIKISQKELDFNTVEGVEKVRKEQNTHFGRSNLFDQDYEQKLHRISQRNLSHSTTHCQDIPANPQKLTIYK